MKRFIGLLIVSAFLAAGSIALAKDYQVTGPVLDVKDDLIVVKKGNENWEIARDKDTKAPSDVKKGDKVLIKYKMTATTIEVKEAAKTKVEAKAKAKTEEKKAEAKSK
jgi:GH43 family beta-xylosidase